MPLQLASPPSNAYDVVAESLSRVSAAGGAANALTNVADPGRLNAGLPHRLYVLSAEDLAQGRHLDNARLIGWRFLLQNGGKTIGAAELACDARGANLRFVSMDTGPFAQATRDAVARAEKLDSVQRGHYELRVLRAASVYTMALWLKDLDGSDDVVIPIGPGPAQGSGAEGGAAPTQSPGEFVQGLRGAASDQLGFDSTPPDRG